MRIDTPITSVAALEALYAQPAGQSLSKETRGLTPAYRAWVERARFFAIATVGPEGVDCSPRGDATGAAFAIEDAETVLIPDRRGNNRLDTLRNLVRDPRCALLFLIPGVLETLRLAGRAEVAADEALRQRFAVKDTLPATVIVLRLEAVYFQCARALIRSDLWEPAAQLAPGAVPSAGEMTRSGDPGFDAASYDAALRPRQRRTLY
ncbi:MAG: MSMEG_1061 family FMN-dependent PPOX-type flavoprotein [Pseudomonadota bacterium]